MKKTDKFFSDRFMNLLKALAEKPEKITEELVFRPLEDDFFSNKNLRTHDETIYAYGNGCNYEESTIAFQCTYFKSNNKGR